MYNLRIDSHHRRCRRTVINWTNNVTYTENFAVEDGLISLGLNWVHSELISGLISSRSPWKFSVPCKQKKKLEINVLSLLFEHDGRTPSLFIQMDEIIEQMKSLSAYQACCSVGLKLELLTSGKCVYDRQTTHDRHLENYPLESYIMTNFFL